MKISSIPVLILGAACLVGCVRSHHAVYYTPTPGAVVAAPAVVVPTTSDQPVERVYPAAPPTVTLPSTPPPGVNAADVNLAASVSELMKGDRGLAAASQNVEASVDHGIVTLRGTVPTDHQRDELVERISRIPGVISVRDQLGVELR